MNRVRKELTEGKQNKRRFPAQLWPLDGDGVRRPERWRARPFGTTATRRERVVSCSESQAWAIEDVTALDWQIASAEQLMLRAALFTRSRCIWRTSYFPGQTLFELWHWSNFFFIMFRAIVLSERRLIYAESASQGAGVSWEAGHVNLKKKNSHFSFDWASDPAWLTDSVDFCRVDQPTGRPAKNMQIIHAGRLLYTHGRHDSQLTHSAELNEASRLQLTCESTRVSFAYFMRVGGSVG